jgi:hypothetical protein
MVNCDTRVNKCKLLNRSCNALSIRRVSKYKLKDHKAYVHTARDIKVRLLSLIDNLNVIQKLHITALKLCIIQTPTPSPCSQPS